jgi:hypothetical protein
MWEDNIKGDLRYIFCVKVWNEFNVLRIGSKNSQRYEYGDTSLG